MFNCVRRPQWVCVFFSRAAWFGLFCPRVRRFGTKIINIHLRCNLVRLMSNRTQAVGTSGGWEAMWLSVIRFNMRNEICWDYKTFSVDPPLQDITLDLPPPPPPTPRLAPFRSSAINMRRLCTLSSRRHWAQLMTKKRFPWKKNDFLHGSTSSPRPHSSTAKPCS